MSTACASSSTICSLAKYDCGAFGARSALLLNDPPYNGWVLPSTRPLELEVRPVAGCRRQLAVSDGVGPPTCRRGRPASLPSSSFVVSIVDAGLSVGAQSAATSLPLESAPIVTSYFCEGPSCPSRSGPSASTAFAPACRPLREHDGLLAGLPHWPPPTSPEPSYQITRSVAVGDDPASRRSSRGAMFDRPCT